MAGVDHRQRRRETVPVYFIAGLSIVRSRSAAQAMNEKILRQLTMAHPLGRSLREAGPPG
jgi:hypothetical protein